MLICITLGLQGLYILLALLIQFVLENKYIECDFLPAAYLQKISADQFHNLHDFAGNDLPVA